MSTRTDLFYKWSDSDGYAFFLGNNKMRQVNSISMLMQISNIPPSFVEKGVPQYGNQDLENTGNLTVQMLAMEPWELFPFTFMMTKALFELRTLKGTFPVMNGQSILSVLREEYTLHDVITHVRNDKIVYQLTIVNGKSTINFDNINEEQVYVKIEKKSLSNRGYVPAEYEVWDKLPDENEILKYYFYAKNNEDKEKRVNFADVDNKQINYDKKITKWICKQMNGTLELNKENNTRTAYDEWYDLLKLNKDRAQKRGYTTEKAEYLKSILSWSLNTYVMLQDKIPEREAKDMRKITYLDLQHADRELTLFTV